MEEAISLVLTFLMLMPLYKAMESPSFTFIYSGLDFEIRRYTNSPWMTAPFKDTSFQLATRNGFDRLTQYIQGANAKSSTAPMTIPVLTNIVSSEPKDVRIYMPAEFQPEPPLPQPELNLKADTWKSRCVAIRMFSGYATDSNVSEEAKELLAILRESTWGIFFLKASDNTYSIAQYSSWTVNEVWVDADDCSKFGSS